MITNLKPVEYSAQLIITTEQLANFYETEVKRISENFNRNLDHLLKASIFSKLKAKS